MVNIWLLEWDTSVPLSFPRATPAEAKETKVWDSPVTGWFFMSQNCRHYLCLFYLAEFCLGDNNRWKRPPACTNFQPMLDDSEGSGKIFGQQYLYMA